MITGLEISIELTKHKTYDWRGRVIREVSPGKWLCLTKQTKRYTSRWGKKVVWSAEDLVLVKPKKEERAYV